MTGTASGGDGPSLTRAERRRKRSWLERRRARRTARRRDPERRSGRRPHAEPGLATDTARVALPQPESRTVGAPSVAAATRVRVPARGPAPDPADEPTLEAPRPADRRRRRRTRRNARRAAAGTTRAEKPPKPPKKPSKKKAEKPPKKKQAKPRAAARGVAPPAPVPARAEPPVPAAAASAPAAAPPSRRARRTASGPPAAPARAPAPKARRTRPRRQPGDRRFWTRVMPAIAGVLVVAVVVGAVVRSQDHTGSSEGSAAGPATPISELPMLLVHRGTDGNDLLAIADRDGDQGSVLLVPVATQLDVPSQGTSVLSEIPTDDGGALLTNSVENEVGVRIGRTVIVDDAGLTAALGPAAPIAISLANPVGFSDRSTKYRQGAQEVSAAQASELMSAPEAVNELDRLVVVASVLDGWMDRLRGAAIGRATEQLQPGFAPLVAAAGAPERRIDTVPVSSISTGGGERFDVRTGELRTIVGRAFPHSQLGQRGRRPRVEILNGTGALGVAQAVAAKVVPAGGKVNLTDNLPGFGLTETQIVYYDDRWRAAAQAIVDAMGCGSLRKAGQDVRIADVTILVGSDCPAYGAPGGGT